MGYNWRSSLGDYAATSGVLAGFCFALIVFVLGWNVANSLMFCSITYAQVSVLVIGIASAFYIAAGELFLTAKDFYVWELPEARVNAIKKANNFSPDQWETTRSIIDAECLRCYQRARTFYNFGMLFIFVGIAVVIAPLSSSIALIVGGLGIVVEVWQYVASKQVLPRIEKQVRDALVEKKQTNK